MLAPGERQTGSCKLLGEHVQQRKKKSCWRTHSNCLSCSSRSRLCPSGSRKQQGIWQLSSVMVRLSLVASMITRLSSDSLSYSSMSAPLRVRQSSSSSTRPDRETGALGRGFIFLLALWAGREEGACVRARWMGRERRNYTLKYSICIDEMLKCSLERVGHDKSRFGVVV